MTIGFAARRGPDVTQCRDFPQPAQARLGSQAANAFQQAWTMLVAGNTVFIVIGAGVPRVDDGPLRRQHGDRAKRAVVLWQMWRKKGDDREIDVLE